MRLLVVLVLLLLPQLGDSWSAGAAARRVAASLFAAAALSSLQPDTVVASEAAATAKATLEISIARGKSKPIKLELYGREAPTASRVFLSICSGDNAYGLSYDEAGVSRVVRDEEFTVDKFYKGADMKQVTEMDAVGKVRIKSIDLAANVVHNDNNERRNKRGVISVPKGGKSFAFSIALGESKRLDDQNVVIGQVVSDEAGALDEINAVPTSKEDSLKMKGGFAALGRAAGDGRAKLASVDRPLVKIKVVSCTVDSEASIGSFLTPQARP